MPARKPWSAQMSATLHEMRSAGVSWAAISAKLAVSRSTAISRGRDAGFPARVSQATATQPRETLDRPPLPPGATETWGLIVANTTLAGARYPVWEGFRQWMR